MTNDLTQLQRENEIAEAREMLAEQEAAKQPEDEYLVSWVIDITADSPEEAAEKALYIQQNPGTWATVFDVKNKRTGEKKLVDLSPREDEQAEAPTDNPDVASPRG